MAGIDYFLPREGVDLHSNNLNDKLIVLISTSACCIAIYAVLATIVSKPTMNEVYLIIISYFILITFLTLEVIKCFFFFGKSLIIKSLRA